MARRNRTLSSAFTDAENIRDLQSGTSHERWAVMPAASPVASPAGLADRAGW